MQALVLPSSFSSHLPLSLSPSFLPPSCLPPSFLSPFPHLTAPTTCHLSSVTGAGVNTIATSSLELPPPRPPQSSSPRNSITTTHYHHRPPPSPTTTTTRHLHHPPLPSPTTTITVRQRQEGVMTTSSRSARPGLLRSEGCGSVWEMIAGGSIRGHQRYEIYGGREPQGLFRIFWRTQQLDGGCRPGGRERLGWTRRARARR